MKFTTSGPEGDELESCDVGDFVNIGDEKGKAKYLVVKSYYAQSLYAKYKKAAGGALDPHEFAAALMNDGYIEPKSVN